MKILLHICCAPCLIYPLQALQKKDFAVTALFYNPNIHPFSEYEHRRQAVADYAKTVDLEVIYPEYNPKEFFQAVHLKEDSSQRCLICWSLRLKKTAQAAGEKKQDYFSTTLLVSPYQGHELLKKIGNTIAEEEGVNFSYQDFRPGFKEAHQEARQAGIYCQKYCGCIYSEIERCKRLQKR